MTVDNLLDPTRKLHAIINTYSHVYSYVYSNARAWYTVITFERYSTCTIGVCACMGWDICVDSNCADLANFEVCLSTSWFKPSLNDTCHMYCESPMECKSGWHLVPSAPSVGQVPNYACRTCQLFTVTLWFYHILVRDSSERTFCNMALVARFCLSHKGKHSYSTPDGSAQLHGRYTAFYRGHNST